MRFLEQMGGVAMGRPAAVAGLTPAEPHRTTASSSLGLMLSAGGAMGGGSHGTTPSNTSRFYSVDVGRKSSKCRTAASALDPRSSAIPDLILYGHRPRRGQPGPSPEHRSDADL